MSKKSTYNSPFFNSFPTRLHGTQIRFGALVGSTLNNGQREIIFAAATPPQQNEDGEPIPHINDVAALLKSKVGTPFTTWAVQHAAAIQKLLPGGLEPCGCFVVVDEAGARDLAPVLSAVLKNIKEPLVLSIDPSTKKLTFWQYVSGAKPTLRSATIKPEDHKDALLVWSVASVDIMMSCPSLDNDSKINDTLPSIIEKNVLEALTACSCGLTVDGKPGVRILDMKSEATVSSLVPQDCESICLEFLRSGTCLVDGRNADNTPCIRHTLLIVSPVLLLRRNAEIRHVVEMMRKSICSSAHERVQLAVEETEGDTKVLQLPWRALCCPQGMELSIWCGDYCMPDEGIESAKERLGQLLGHPQSMFDDAPKHMNERKLLDRNHKGTYESPVTAPEPNQSSSSGKAPVPAAACAAAVAALALALLIPLLLRT